MLRVVTYLYFVHSDEIEITEPIVMIGSATKNEIVIHEVILDIVDERGVVVKLLILPFGDDVSDITNQIDLNLLDLGVYPRP